MPINQKVIVLPPELIAKADELDANGCQKSFTALVAEHHAPQWRKALREWAARPKPFTLLSFFEQQGEALMTELADGISHIDLFLRYTARPNSPVKCTYAPFSTALAEFRRLKGLPPKQKPRAESVTDPASRAGKNAPATPPAAATVPPEPTRRRRRRDGHGWNPFEP